MAVSAIISTNYPSVETSIIDKTNHSSRTQDSIETTNPEIYDSPRSHASSEGPSSTGTGGFLDDADNTSSDGGEVVNDDSDAVSSDHVSLCLVYSVAFMLRLRMAVGRRFPVSCTSSRAAADLPGCSDAAPENKGVRNVPATCAPDDDEVSALYEHERIERAVRSILNKLTMEKFDALYEQLATVGLRTPEHITVLMREIFEKSTLQHKFIEMYADLCVRLEKDPRIVQAAEADGNGNSFLQLLMSQCQVAFEQFLEPPKPVGACDEDDEARALRKLRALGNVKLVGQLMVRGVLSSKLLCRCAEELMCGEEVPCPEALESLAALLIVTGPTFDTPSWKRHSKLGAIFVRLRGLLGDKRVPSRVRFILRDVLDLRAAMWSDSARHKSTGLEEVRKKAEKAPCILKAEASAVPAKDVPAKAKQMPQHVIMHAAVKAQAPWRSRRTGQAGKPSLNETSHETGTWKEEVFRLSSQTEQTDIPEKAVDIPLMIPFHDSGGTFDHAAFHWKLSGIMKELGQDRDVSAAVRKVCAQHVPEVLQAKVFADILSRAADETRGPARRSSFAFAAGLAVPEPHSAFVRSECLNGARVFFQEIYEELCADIPRLDLIAASEIVPALQSVFPEVAIMSCWPEYLRP